jgi:HD-GYP domain-containing protein (c-di-GMP phosphodiesterase class II)
MSTLKAFETAMQRCDAGLPAHAERVGAHAATIARRLGWGETQLDSLAVGVALHDVGKVAVPKQVLAKPGPLDSAEMEHVRAHPVEGAWLIAGLPAFAPALPYVLFHHERWDGGGYPTRRAGENIPIEGRLLAVADAFDAMTSVRPYRDALPVERAIEEVDRCAGTQFDPRIVETFVSAWKDGEVVLEYPAALAV